MINNNNINNNNTNNNTCIYTHIFVHRDRYLCDAVPGVCRSLLALVCR